MEANPIMFFLTIALGLAFAAALGVLFSGILYSLNAQNQAEWAEYLNRIETEWHDYIAQHSPRGEMISC